MINKTDNILIVGLGLLGGSYAKCLSDKGYNVNAITRRQETIDYALKHNYINQGSILVEELISDADYIIMGLYPELMIEWIKSYQHLIKDNVIISDVSGVKTNVVEPIQNILNDNIEFISAHPMAGKESSGIEHADPSIFKKANYIITPTSKNTKRGIDFSYELATLLEFRHICELSVDKHDEMIAFLSQLTHVIAVSLMNTHDNSHLVDYTGDSFRDLTRIAKINENMWSELFLLNKENLLDEIDMFTNSLLNFRKSLADEDIDKMKDLFRQSTKRRKCFDQ